MGYINNRIETIKPGSAANTYQADRCVTIGCMVRLYHSLRTHRQTSVGFCLPTGEDRAIERGSGRLLAVVRYQCTGDVGTPLGTDG